MSESLAFWQLMQAKVDEKLHQWMHTCPASTDPKSVRHIVVLAPDAAKKCKEGASEWLMGIGSLIFENDKTAHILPRYPGASYLFTLEGIEYYVDNLGIVQSCQIMIGLSKATLDMGLAASEGKVATGLTPVWEPPKVLSKQPWYGKGLYEKLALSAQSVPAPHGGSMLILTHAGAHIPAKMSTSTLLDVIARPYLYLVCECCGNLRDKPPIGQLNALICAHCHGYNHSQDCDRVKAAAKKILEESPNPG